MNPAAKEFKFNSFGKAPTPSEAGGAASSSSAAKDGSADEGDSGSGHSPPGKGEGEDPGTFSGAALPKSAEVSEGRSQAESGQGLAESEVAPAGEAGAEKKVVGGGATGAGAPASGDDLRPTSFDSTQVSLAAPVGRGDMGKLGECGVIWGSWGAMGAGAPAPREGLLPTPFDSTPNFVAHAAAAAAAAIPVARASAPVAAPAAPAPWEMFDAVHISACDDNYLNNYYRTMQRFQLPLETFT
eukprot:gene14339-20332_t